MARPAQSLILCLLTAAVSLNLLSLLAAVRTENEIDAGVSSFFFFSLSWPAQIHLLRRVSDKELKEKGQAMASNLGLQNKETPRLESPVKELTHSFVFLSLDQFIGGSNKFLVSLSFYLCAATINWRERNARSAKAVTQHSFFFFLTSAQILTCGWRKRK